MVRFVSWRHQRLTTLSDPQPKPALGAIRAQRRKERAEQEHAEQLRAELAAKGPTERELEEERLQASVDPDTAEEFDRVVRLPVRGRNNTDVGNARRLTYAYGDELRYVPQWNSWIAWDGRRWQPDAAGQVVERAKDVAADLYAQGLKATGDDRQAILKWALRSETAARIEAMIRLARSEPGIPVEPRQLDSDPWALNVRNGTLNLRTGEIRPHRPSDLATKLADVDYLPDTDAPTFLAFLERIIPDPAVRAFLQRAAGYSLTGCTSEQVLVFAHGAGANGKTTFLSALLATWGEYGRQAEPDLLLARGDVHPTGVADLHGARLVVCAEVEAGRRFAESQVKQLTGSDPITARRMRQDFWTFRPTHTLWLAANHRPVVRGTDHAIWRRIRLVPFGVTIPPAERDRHLAERLEAERAGILAWAVRGAVEWHLDGLGDPAAVIEATDAYRAEQDVTGDFLSDTCVVNAEAKVSAFDLYRAYTRWCDENGERPQSQRGLGAALTERNFERRKFGPARHWHWFGLGILGQVNP